MMPFRMARKTNDIKYKLWFIAAKTFNIDGEYINFYNHLGIL